MNRWTRVAADALSVLTIVGFLALEAWFIAGGIDSGDYAYDSIPDVLFMLAFVTPLYATAFVPVAWGSILARRLPAAPNWAYLVRPLAGQLAGVAVALLTVGAFFSSESSTAGLAFLGLPMAGIAAAVGYGVFSVLGRLVEGRTSPRVETR